VRGIRDVVRSPRRGGAGQAGKAGGRTRIREGGATGKRMREGRVRRGAGGEERTSEGIVVAK
jgi:hypothetical protein